MAAFGVKVTVIEPGGFSTDWGGASAKHTTPLSDYDGVREERARFRAARVAIQGDPAATRSAVLKIVDAEEPPLRVFFGENPLAMATNDYESRLATWRRWQPVSIEAQGT